MISLTTLASTPMLEKKQTTESLTQVTDAVNVQCFEATIFVVANFENHSQRVFTKSFSPDYSAVLVDNSYESTKQFSSNAIYKENLNSEYTTDFRKRISKLGIKQYSEFS
jgi:hypothetical protein